ncbi:DUF1905 domain-containing protein [Flavobacterium cyanobacteriorum]|uniref:DUF1905 domain-containing protein n=1 Tax=Flavobacterium cyanobacteriorum TaxID=2022802 RepID=A0A255Z1Z5_9FLAO|nr:YdeI/OmpD-associated family protein [Flavobacterium cyanobacteriorum]OYQ35472.1 DUF1905 domain-containing protein [Flavobacterium cyanobacteriorum]
MEFEQELLQLEKHKGGYCYLFVSAETVDTFPEKRKTRLICTIDGILTLRCGLNHLGEGNFFVIVSSKHLKRLDKEPGDLVTFTLAPDPDPLGVDMPEVLEALLEQDEEAKKIFESYTPGKKRSLIFSIAKIKDTDKQVQSIIKFLSGRTGMYRH